MREYCSFQQRITKECHTNYDVETPILIPEVSLRDEITTVGYGMAIIEILVMVGILIEEKNDKGVTTWTLGDKYNEK